MPQETRVELFVEDGETEGKSKGKLFPITVLCLFGCVLIIMLGLIREFKVIASNSESGKRNTYGKLFPIKAI